MAILVGTYKIGQFKNWHGYYNYPIAKDEEVDLKQAAKIKELWLFNGVQDQRTFSAEFIGLKTRKELIDDYGYRGAGKAHADKYMLFKTERLLASSTSSTDKVIIRVSDFVHRSPKIAAQLRDYLNKSDRNDFAIAERLPSVITKLAPERLCVCDSFLQYDLWGNLIEEEKKDENFNAWDKNVEVEKSAYQWTRKPFFFNRKDPLVEGKRNVLELFCGCGGTSYGFEMAGYQTVLGVDILAPAIETFRNNHRTAAAFLGDMRSLSAEEIKEKIPQNVDVVIAGIPCQGFSLNNRKRHDGDSRNTLYLELLKVLRAVKPKAVVVENVSGIRSSANGEVVKEIEKGIFEACGLTVRHQLLHAEEYGVPQRRARVVFVGVKDSKGFDFNKMTKLTGPGTGHPYVTVRDAIGDLPPLASGEHADAYTCEPQTDYQRLMRNGADKLLDHEAPTHPQETIDKIANTKPGEPMYPKFRQRIRLSWEDTSPTQVSGGIRPQFQFGHPGQARGLSIRERCRIQSFPDTFKMAGGLVQGRVQTGNAVPPLLAKAVAEALKQYI